MKLWQRKKKNTDAQVELSLEPKTSKGKSQSLPLLAGFVVLFAIFSAAAYLFWLAQTQQEQASQEQSTQAWATAFSSNIEKALAFIDFSANNIVQTPTLITATQLDDSRLMGVLAQQMRRQAFVVDALIYSKGQADSRINTSSPVNFAALELIHSAEGGNRPPVEFFTLEDKKYLYKVQPIIDARSDTVVGTLLLIYDAAIIYNNLPQIHNQALQVSLVQKLPRVPEVNIFNVGHAFGDNPTIVRTTHPNWSLRIQQSPQDIQNNPGFMLSALALLIALVAGILALAISHIGFTRQLNRDCKRLSPLLFDWHAGKSLTSDGVRTHALRKLVASLPHSTLSMDLTRDRPIAAEESIIDPESQLDTAFLAEPVRQTDTATTPLAKPHSPLSITILDEEDESEIFDFELAENPESEELNLDDLNLDLPAEQTDTDGRDDVPESIFRAYDIRGIVNETLTAKTAYWIGRAIGAEVLDQGFTSVVAGRDGRLSSPELSESLTLGLAQAGCDVIDLGTVPTPVLYFATHTLEATSGVMLTGSHNPANYNGFKIVIAGETLADEQIQALYQRIHDNRLSQGSGLIETMDILPTYLARIRDDVVLAKPLKVVLDCGNGVAGVIAEELFTELGCDVVPLFCDVDGNFPNHHPDPSKPENLASLISAVESHQADIGLAFDGDADRVAVVTNKGRIIHADHLMMLLAKDMVSRHPGADIVFDVKCSRRLAALISGYGGRPIMWKTGHSLMKAKMRETNALLGGEMSGHIFYKERWYGFDDGLYSAARLLEIISLDNRSTEQIFSAFSVGHATPELSISVTEESKNAIIEHLKTTARWGGAKVTTLDGIRVDYQNSWGLIRPSNTTPTLVLRFEGDTELDLQKIMQLFRIQLKNAKPDLPWPF